MTRGRFVFRDGELVERKTGEPLAAPDRITSPMLVRDVHYKSPLSRKEITSRSQRREEMKVHEVREVDPSEFTPVYHTKKYAERQRGHYQPPPAPPKDEAPYVRLSRDDLPARLKT